MFQFSNGSMFDTIGCSVSDILGRIHLGWFHPMKRMRATRVGPYLEILREREKAKESERMAKGEGTKEKVM